MAFDAGKVMEVLPPIPARPLPGAPPFVRGICKLRGELGILVDARCLLDVTAEDRMVNRVIATTAGEESGPGWRIAVWVDRVIGLEPVDFGEANSHAGVVGTHGRRLGRVAQTSRGLV